MTRTRAEPPPRVARGQLVGVVAPGGPVPIERLSRGLARLGEAFELRLAPSVTAPRAPELPGYLAAPDEVRAAELNAMLADPDVRAIICTRGGYGAMRILPALDASLLRRDPKPIVGFSDVTALLSWAHAAGVRGIHGPMVGQLGELADGDVAQLIDLLTLARPLGELRWPLRALGAGRVHGALVPGNLTMVSMLVGTPWAVPLDGAVALLEEVGERPYELDRYFTQLALTGALAHTTAVVLGDLVRCGEPAAGDAPDPALAVVIERVAAARLPLAIGAPVGHGDRNAALPFGARCELDLDRGTLAITEPAVR